MKTIDFLLPVYYAVYFINCDASGLNDNEIQIIDKFEAANVKRYGKFYCVNADVENSYFSPFNDMPGMSNIGSDVCIYTFAIDDNYII